MHSVWSLHHCIREYISRKKVHAFKATEILLWPVHINWVNTFVSNNFVSVRLCELANNLQYHFYHLYPLVPRYVALASLFSFSFSLKTITSSLLNINKRKYM